MEEWKAVPGFEVYEVSDQGRVRRNGRTLSPWIGSHGYPSIGFSIGGKVTTFTVHSIVALAFLGPRPMDMEVRHLNGDRSDPRLVNLSYSSHSENELDKRSHGTNRNRQKTHCSWGHPYDEQNTRWEARGSRTCKKCDSKEFRRYRKRLKEAT